MLALGSELLIYQVAETKAALLPVLAAWDGRSPFALDASGVVETIADAGLADWFTPAVVEAA